MSKVRPNAPRPPSVQNRPANQPSAPQRPKPPSTSPGYDGGSSFSEVKEAAAETKKLIGDFKLDGFSETRLKQLRDEALDKVDEMLARKPPPSPEEAAKELEAIADKFRGGAFVENQMFKTMWDNIQKQYEKSVEEMRRNYSSDG